MDRSGIGAELQARPGIGPWTAAYIAMRGLGDPDVMLAGDLGVRHAVAALGGDDRAREIEKAAHAWRPWRSYAVAHLWASLSRLGTRCRRRAPIRPRGRCPTHRTPPRTRSGQAGHDRRRTPRRGGPTEGDLMTSTHD